MIEKTILDFLSEKLSPVIVYTERPVDPEETYVILEKTGSGKDNHICSAMIALQSYAGSLLAAAELNEKVKTAMDDLISLDEICKVKLNTDYNYTDTETKQYRYQAVYDIYHY